MDWRSSESIAYWRNSTFKGVDKFLAGKSARDVEPESTESLRTIG